MNSNYENELRTEGKTIGQQYFFRKRKRKMANSLAFEFLIKRNNYNSFSRNNSKFVLNDYDGKPPAHHLFTNCLTYSQSRKMAPILIMIILLQVTLAFATLQNYSSKLPEINTPQSLINNNNNETLFNRKEENIFAVASSRRTDDVFIEHWTSKLNPLNRVRRSATSGSVDSTTNLVAVSGQWVELQCPFAGEMITGSGSGNKVKKMVVWRRNGASLNQLDPRRYRLSAQNGSLVLAGAQPKVDEGDYECALVSTATSSTINDDSSSQQDTKQPQATKLIDWPPTGSGKLHKFQLKLLIPPRLAQFEFPKDTQVGMKLVLTCSALEGQQPISFVWLKDNQIIWASGTGSAGGTSGGSSAQSPEQQQHNNRSLLTQLHGQQLADKLALTSNHQISLAYSDNFPSDDTNPNQQTSSSSSLSLLSDPNIRIRQSDDYSILSIERLELKHTGRYTCSAQNEAARTSHSSQLLINAPPSLTIEPQDGDLVSGQSSVIDCLASGQPKPTISWLRARDSGSSNSRVLQQHWDYVPVYDNLRYTTLTNGSLVIANVSMREQGYYLCSAKNGFGPEVTKLIKITVHEPAKFSLKYQTVEVRVEERANIICSASGELPIALEWLDKEGNPIQRNDKRFIIDHDPQDIINREEDLQTNNRSVSRLILTRSSRADSGHYTCQASNKHGSDKMVINLLVQDVPDKVTELKVTNVTATTISVRWQLAFSGNSPITSYLVQYQSDDPLDDLLTSQLPLIGAGKSSSSLTSVTQSPLLNNEQQQQQVVTTSSNQQTPETTQSTTLALRAALDALNIASNLDRNADEIIDRTLVELTVEQSSTNLVVKDLSPYCVYRLRLAGINKIGLGEFSDWIRAKTEEAPPTGSGSKISAAATGPNSIKVTWSPPDRRSWNGQLIGFNIGYRPIDSSFELNKTIEWSPPSFQSIMLNHHHHQHLTDVGGGKSTNRSSSLMMMTTKFINGKNNTNSEVIKQEGKASNQEPLEQSQYILRQHLRQLLALQQQELVAHLTNLQRSTTYLVYIQAVNQRGFGPQSHAISIKTLDDVPPSAPAIKVQSTSVSSITVAWSMLSNFVSSANQYSLFYRRLPQQQQQLLSQQTNSRPFLIMHQSSNSSSTIQDPAFLSPIEPGPFIERTMTSQQLMVGNFASTSGSGDEAAAGVLLLDQVKPSFMHNHQQQQQQYQQFVYTLDQLECGSVYELYMTTRNSVGKSEPSQTVTTRTMGEPPLAPINKNTLFSKIGSNEVALNLIAWSTGGCPITQVIAKYKQVPLAQQLMMTSGSGPSTGSGNATQGQITLGWPITTTVPASVLTALNNQQLQRQQATNSYSSIQQKQNFGTTSGSGAGLIQPEVGSTIHLLKNLMPSTAYELELIAINAAGHTSAQYEFVTSNINGTRAGFSRKEVYHHHGIDQRSMNENGGSPLPADGGQRPMEQPFTDQSGAGAQLLPIILMILCFICLIISSAFCYNRLTDSWKRPRRSSSNDSSQQNNNQQGAGSPMSKSSMVWRLNNTNHHHHHQQRSTFGKHQANSHHHHLDDNSQILDESPSTRAPAHHYHCMREPTVNLTTGTNAINPDDVDEPQKPFSQSVSMKDFNLALANSTSSHHHARGISSTLNFKNRQRTTLDSNQVKMLAGTLRHPRLLAQEPFQDNTQLRYDPNNTNLCPYGTGSCQKQKQSIGQLDSSLANNQVDYQPTNNFGHYTSHGEHQCGNYAANNGEEQQQETSWTTNYGQTTNQYLKHNQQVVSGTTYAIPATATLPAINYNDQLGNYGTNQQQLEYSAQQQQENYNNNNNNNIDACIQQLMDEQYQQEQQQQHQQYAVILNQKVVNNNNLINQSNKCLYGNEPFNNSTTTNNNLHQLQHHQILSANHDQVNQQLSSLISTSNNNNNGVAQSIVDSSSSSSGIDIGNHHLDCASTTTGTSHSNGSSTTTNNNNNGYQLMTAPITSCDQQQEFNNDQLQSILSSTLN